MTGAATVSANSSPEHAQHRLESSVTDCGSDQPKQSEDDMLLSGEQSVLGNSSQLNTVLMCIEKALHLNLPKIPARKETAQTAGADDSNGQAFVRVAYKEAEQWASTTAVAAAPGSGAVWHHEVQFGTSTIHSSTEKTQELQVIALAASHFSLHLSQPSARLSCITVCVQVLHRNTKPKKASSNV